MKVGIKYCGGCNPRYDRVAFVNQLKAEFPQVQFVTASGCPDCDIVLLVCGCTAICADRTGLVAKYEMIGTCQMSDIDMVREKIKELCPDWEHTVVDIGTSAIGMTKTEETIAFEESQAEAVARAKKTEQEEAAKWMKMVMPLSGK